MAKKAKNQNKISNEKSTFTPPGQPPGTGSGSGQINSNPLAHSQWRPAPEGNVDIFTGHVIPDIGNTD
jgi:hypothetical protein